MYFLTPMFPRRLCEVGIMNAWKSRFVYSQCRVKNNRINLLWLRTYLMYEDIGFNRVYGERHGKPHGSTLWEPINSKQINNIKK